MDKEKEKQTVYKSLVELTKAPGDSNAYFTRGKIMENIHNGLKGEHDLYHIDHRNGYTFQDEKIDLREVIPLNKNIPEHLEELVEEGKVNRVMPISKGWEAPYERGTELLYRANLE